MDSVGKPLETNLYSYVGGNPLSFTDPLGLWRWPDYLSFTVNVGTPLVGWSGGVVLDRYGNLYWAPLGVTIGKSATIVSGSLSGGWLFRCGAPGESSLQDFLSGHGLNVGGGFLGGGGITWSPGQGLAGEAGVYSPQVGVSYHYSWQRGKLGLKW